MPPHDCNNTTAFWVRTLSTPLIQRAENTTAPEPPSAAARRMYVALLVVFWITTGAAVLCLMQMVLFKRREKGVRLWDTVWASLMPKLQRFRGKIGKFDPFRRHETMIVALEMQAPIAPHRTDTTHITVQQPPRAPRRSETSCVVFEAPKPVAAKVAPPRPPREEVLPLATLRVSGLHIMKAWTREGTVMTPEEWVAEWVADVNAETDLEKGWTDVPL